VTTLQRAAWAEHCKQPKRFMRSATSISRYLVAVLAWLSVFVPYLGRAVPFPWASEVPSGRAASVILLSCSIAIGITTGASLRSIGWTRCLLLISWPGAAVLGALFHIRDGEVGPAATRVLWCTGQAVVSSWWLLSLRTHCLRPLGPLGVSLAICAGLGLAVLALNPDVYLRPGWANTSLYLDAKIASRISLSLLFGLLAGWALTWLPRHPLATTLVLIVMSLGMVACLQRWLLFAVPLVMLLCLRRQLRSAVPILIGLGLTTLFAIANQLPIDSDNFLTYLQDFTDRQSGLVSRMTLAQDALAQFLQHPIGGVGLDHWEDGMWPHNFAIQSLSDLGFFAGLSSLLLLGLCCMTVWRGASDDQHRFPIAVVAIMAWLFSLKSGDLTAISLLLPLSLMSSMAREPSSHSRGRSSLRANVDAALRHHRAAVPCASPLLSNRIP
jgi:hypothetical protein